MKVFALRVLRVSVVDSVLKKVHHGDTESTEKNT